MTHVRPLLGDADPRARILPTRYDAARILDRGDRLSYVDTDVPWWCQVDADEVDRLTELLVTDGLGAVRAELAKINEYLGSYVADGSRGTAIAALLTAGGQPETIIDLGPGWGAPGESLARLAKTYIAVDTNEHTLRFLRERLRGLESEQAYLRCGSLGSMAMPVADGVADAVIVNGVLEWVGADDSRSAAMMQRTFLRDVHRVLADDGRMIVGIENRWGLQYMFGARDHPGTRFTSLLPRRAADAVLRRKRGAGYWELTHGIDALRALIADAGFTIEAVHWTQPSYRENRLVVPITDGATTRRALRAVTKASLMAADHRQRASALLSFGVRTVSPLRGIAPNVLVTARKG